ncbi:MAG: ABC transporter ATP-binding protein [Clostridia bacterium]|nr:ABC transporter ATP-binding protein [Clostridia bacterium]
MTSTAIELKGIRKVFGNVVANDQVDLSVRKGEILALLGENGSGKTTLMNMLSGIYQPDGGTIKVNGKVVHISSPEDSKKFGIGMIHQHFKLVELFSGIDNVLLGSSKQEFFLRKKRINTVNQAVKDFGLSVDLSKKVYDMSVSEKQSVEIIKVLFNGAKILILDEPTAVLTPQETQVLFDILRKMRDNGCAIVIITHKLNEVLEISDRVTILRKGKSIATVTTSETTAEELTELMVGHAVKLEIERPEVEVEDSPLFSVHHLVVENEDKINIIDDISFDLRRGEILGVAGVAGSGQKELCESIAGLQKVKRGAILYEKENIVDKKPMDIIKLGISMSFIPEDRLGMGLSASMGIRDNMLLKNYRKSKGLFVDRKKATETANEIVNKYDISAPDIVTPVSRLSGGNVQKVLLGREIEAKPNVIITAYPVRGLDINSSYVVYNALNASKKMGAGVLFIGEDLDVMLELCDRIMVLCHGKITGVVDAKTTTKEKLGLLMTGVKEVANSDD